MNTNAVLWNSIAAIRSVIIACVVIKIQEPQRYYYF